MEEKQSTEEVLLKAQRFPAVFWHWKQDQGGTAGCLVMRGRRAGGA